MRRDLLQGCRLLPALLLLSGMALADPLLLNQERFTVNVLTEADYLADPAGEFSLDEVREDEVANRFTPVHQNVLRYGVFSGSYWLRLTLTNPDGQPRELAFLFDSHANHQIHLYHPNSDDQ